MRQAKIHAAVFAAALGLLLAGCAKGSSGETVQTVAGWETIPAAEEKTPAESAGTIPGNEGTETVRTESEAPAEEAVAEAVSEEAASEETESTEAQESSTETSPGSSTGESGAALTLTGTLSGSALADSIQTIITENGLDGSNFSISYENLVTGETLYCNELAIMTPASTYKLPLNMYYYDAEARGEMSEEDVIPGVGLTLAECHYKSLVLSDNPSSEAMLSNISFTDFRQYLTKYFTLSSSEIGETYWRRNFYCTRMMADIAAYLYRNADSYGACISYLKQAMPGMYFRRHITDCEIAQKYGKLNGWENCVGIIYGRRPFALCVYTYGKSEDLVAWIAQTVYAYEEAQ